MSTVTGTRGAGNGLAANQKPDVWETLMVLEPYQTPLMQHVFFGNKKSKPVYSKQGKFIWFEDELLPHQTAITADIAKGASFALTTSNVSDVSIFTVDDLVYIEETDEMGRISAVGTGTATLVPAAGTGTFTAVTAAAALKLKIIASMNAEDATKRVAKSTQEVEKSNYLTIMSDTVSNTGRDQAGKNYTDGLTHAEQVQKKMKEMKLNFERLAALSRQSGNTASAGSMVKTYGKGMLGFLTTNVKTYSTLDEATFDSWLQTCGEKGTPNKMVLAGSDVYYKMQSVIKAKLGTIGPNNVIKRYGVDLTEYKLGPLNIHLAWDPVLDGKFSKWALLLDEDKLVARHMANDDKGSRKFRVEPNVQTPGSDTKDTKILADIGVQYMNETTGGVLKYVAA